MRYLDICSGISAPTAAWKPLGWQCAAFSEIEPFPRAVLAHHYPDTPLHGDFTTIGADQYGSIDLLVGGTPCQSFSVAGLRGGLADDRGNLALEYLRLADRTRPRWLVWENVPGVLSSNGGRDFGAILGGMGELGYGFAYRVLDAQHFGVPQRRRRVFVVGHLGNWRRAAAVLFERHSLQGNPAPRREARKDVAPTTAARTRGSGGLGTDFDCDGGLVARSLAIRGRDGTPQAELGDEVANTILTPNGGRAGVGCGAVMIAARMTAFGEYVDDGTASTCKQRDWKDATDLIAHSLRGEGFDASEDGTGRGTPLVPVAIQAGALRENVESGPDGVGVRTDGIAYTLEARAEVQAICFSAKDHGADAMHDLSPTLRAGGHSKSHANAGVMPAVAFAQNQRDEVRMMHVAGALADEPGMKQQTYVATSAVRRLTPRECERLQGFPDDFTLVPYRNKPAADGPRYKALGNSMAVPVVRWIGERIATVDAIPVERKAAA